MDFLLDDDCSEETRLKEEQFEKLEQALNMLSIIDKTIMLLALEELSYKEIADVIGITEPNVRVKIHRIKSQLKIELKEDNYGNNS
jgi:RNA polymerase sigma-70 factor (ECF subfamily)